MGVNRSAMVRVVVLAFVVAAIPWAIATRWNMHRSQSARERAWVARVGVGAWFGSLLASLALVFLTMRGQFLAFPVIGAAVLAVRQGLRRARARIRAEEATDAFSRAKRVN